MKVIPPVIVGGGPTRGIAETISNPPDIEEIKKKLKEAKKAEGKPAPNKPRRRQPKPPPNFGTLLLIKFIPFLNCDPGKPGEMIGHIVTRMETWAGVDDDFVWRWAKSGEIIRGVRETQADIKTMLIDPINPAILQRMNSFLSILSPIALPMGSALVKVLQGGAFPGGPFPKNFAPHYKCLQMSLSPRGSDRDFFMDSQGFADFDKIWVPGFRGMLYALAAEAFEVADIETKKSNVSFYVGRCPRCGIVFEKTRGNQDYCGEQCRKADGMKKLRKKWRGGIAR